MELKVAITTNNDGSKIAEQAEHASFFKIYTIDEEQGVINEKLIQIDKENDLHTLLLNPNIETNSHEILQVQMILTEKMEQSTIEKLTQIGIRGYLIKENDKSTKKIIEKLINGTLEAIVPTNEN